MFGFKQIITERSAPLELTTADGERLCLYGPVVDSMRNMASLLMSSDKLPGCLGFTSSLQQEGVTYISRAWGLTIANDLQMKVCVVELNWWRPEDILAVQKPSLGVAGMKPDMRLEDVIISTNSPNLSLIPAGKLSLIERPIRARSNALKWLIGELCQQYEHVVLDLPAIRATTDALPLAALADQICLIVEQGVTPVESARLALDSIKHMSIAGIVLNRYKTSIPGWVLNIIPQDVNSFTSA